MTKKVLVLMAMMVFLVAACMPQMVVVTGKSDDLPGVMYAGAYVKHPTGMNVARVDQYKDGVLNHAGNTVCSDGIVNNSFKGSVGSVVQSAGFVWGMSALRPDDNQVNVSGTSSTGPVNASAKAALKNATNVKNTNANFNPVSVKNTNANLNANLNTNLNSNVNKNQNKNWNKNQNQNHNKGFTPPGQEDK